MTKMTKSEQREVATMDAMMRLPNHVLRADVGYFARSYSALIRASRGSRNEIICHAMGVPAVVQHPDFII